MLAVLWSLLENCMSQESDSVIALLVHRAEETDLQWEAKIEQVPNGTSKDTHVPELGLPGSYP